MFKYLLLSLLRTTAFFQHLFFGFVFNHRTLAATALYETYNLPIVKKYFAFVYKVNAVLNVFYLDTPN